MTLLKQALKTFSNVSPSLWRILIVIYRYVRIIYNYLHRPVCESEIVRNV